MKKEPLLRVDGYANAYLINRYLAYRTATKLSPNFSYRKVGKKYERYQEILYKESGYVIQWKNILYDIKRMWAKIGNPIGLIHPLPAYAQFGAIAVDPNWAASTYQAQNAAGLTLTYAAHDVSGTNRFMVATQGWSGGDGPSGATFNGDAMTLTSEGIVLIGVKMYTLIAPDTGANNVVTSLTAGTGHQHSWEISFTGADQTQAGIDTDNTNGTSTTSSSLTLTTTAANSIVIDCIVHMANETTTNGEGTLITDYSVTTPSARKMSGHYIQKATAGNQAMTWSWSSGVNFETAALEILEAAGGAATPSRSRMLTGIGK